MSISTFSLEMTKVMIFPMGMGMKFNLGMVIVRSRINVNGNDPYLRGEKIPMDLCDIVLFH